MSDMIREGRDDFSAGTALGVTTAVSGKERAKL
jgi:hypothetical protein